MSTDSTQPHTPSHEAVAVRPQPCAANQWKRAALMARMAPAFRETVSDDSEDEVDTKKQIKYGSGFQAAKAIIQCTYQATNL